MTSVESPDGAMRRVVFLDRDGVINQDSPDYIKSWAEFEFLPGSLGAIQQLTSAGFTIIIITNQSIINRGMVVPETLDTIFHRMTRAITAAGGRITDIFFCPHTPEDGCDCRKPRTGMLMQAQKKYNIDLSAAVMVGDSAKDIECARDAGCGSAVLVRTGNGPKAEKALACNNVFPDYVARDLKDAACWIIETRAETRT